MDMKKIITCAALLAGIVFFNGRLNAQVESDIVGYQTIEMKAGKWYMVGCPFVALSDETMTINDMMRGFADGDELYVYDNAKGMYSAIRAWKDGAWRVGTADNTIATDVVNPGDAVFVSKAVDSNIIFSGAVSVAETSQFGSEAGPNWSMVTFCYPEKTTIDAIKWVGVKDGDELYIYDNAKSQYTYIRAWKNGVWRVGTADDTIATDTIEPGQGFFISTKSAGNGTLSK